MSSSLQDKIDTDSITETLQAAEHTDTVVLEHSARLTSTYWFTTDVVQPHQIRTDTFSALTECLPSNLYVGIESVGGNAFQLYVTTKVSVIPDGCFVIGQTVAASWSEQYVEFKLL